MRGIGPMDLPEGITDLHAAVTVDDGRFQHQNPSEQLFLFAVQQGLVGAFTGLAEIAPVNADRDE